MRSRRRFELMLMSLLVASAMLLACSRPTWPSRGMTVDLARTNASDRLHPDPLTEPHEILKKQQNK